MPPTWTCTACFPAPLRPADTLNNRAGLMSVWRAFYAAYLDLHSFRSAAATRRDRERDMQAREATPGASKWASRS